MSADELFQGIERRRYVRFYASVPLKYRLLEDGNRPSEWYTGSSSNMGEMGLGVDTGGDAAGLMARLKRKGVLVEVRLALPPAKATPVRAIGKPVWWKRPKVDGQRRLFFGMKYTEIDEKGRQAIRGFIIDQYIDKYKFI